MNNDVKVGDILYCNKSYIDTEVGYRFKEYITDGVLVHLIKGKPYKIEEVINLSKVDISIFDPIGTSNNVQIKVKTEFELYQWYSLSRFDTLKQHRKSKLLKLNESSI